MKQKILICGGTGFIGRNLVEYFARTNQYEIYATHFKREEPADSIAKGRVMFKRADLTQKSEVDKVVRGMDVVIQAAATTSGAKDTISAPYHHVTDNAVMSSLIFRSCFEHQVKHVIFFSCTTMYPNQDTPVKEEDFNYHIIDNYFGVGWTKVYLEKMCEFYSRIGPAKYTAIRHSNIYGPYDKYDLEKSHVFGATVAKVMQARDGKIMVWGDGSEERDLLYVDDLVNFVERALQNQKSKFELVNVGYGKSISILDLVKKIMERADRHLEIVLDRSKPTISFNLSVNIDRAKQIFDWSPQISLAEGIDRSIEWYRKNYISQAIPSNR